ncbi:alpha/beta fold hydrolase [uncultured Streptomyces sp.]|uniref:lipase family alpha/beta hydrolase n=1 Tax=uncultured Streptomyces sp. TaxID=174707 RepID=UPI00260394C9|nr:alpha/beta fold hydrolase [uncultured Streptomyces sp.]
MPSRPNAPRLSSTVLGATVLEVLVLAWHLLLHPSGITPERPRPGGRPDTGQPTDRAQRAGPGEEPGSGTPPAGTSSDSTPPVGTTRPAEAVVTPLGAVQGGGSDADRPVVLLHGFIDNRSVFVLLRRSLARHGRRHLESLNYAPLTCDIRTAAELLGRHVEEICSRTGQREIDIVGHSLGGLIARYYVQRLGGDRRVRVLVTLGTPHGGTAAAPAASVHPIVRQMRGGSALIQELRLPARGCRTLFFSFWSEWDRVMVPVTTARVDHPDLLAQNVRVVGIGHLALPAHPAVAARIRQILDSPGTVYAHDTAYTRDAEDAEDATFPSGPRPPIARSTTDDATVA